MVGELDPGRIIARVRAWFDEDWLNRNIAVRRYYEQQATESAQRSVPLWFGEETQEMLWRVKETLKKLLRGRIAAVRAARSTAYPIDRVTVAVLRAPATSSPSRLSPAFP